MGVNAFNAYQAIAKQRGIAAHVLAPKAAGTQLKANAAQLLSQNQYDADQSEIDVAL